MKETRDGSIEKIIKYNKRNNKCLNANLKNAVFIQIVHLHLHLLSKIKVLK